MVYVYNLQSIDEPARYYVGITEDLRSRLERHNTGQVLHTSKHAPWKIKTYIAFADKKQAVAFEKYLKYPSGRAFSKKRLRQPWVVPALPVVAEHPLPRALAMTK